MPLFQCSKCGVVENTALAEGGYWWEQAESHREKRAFEPKCSQCSTGTWHRQFNREPATGMLLASDGFLYSKAEAGMERKRFRQQGITIVKEIT